MNSPVIQGIKAIFGVFALVLVATFIGIGALCEGYGLSQSWAVVAAGLMWAGPAQVILVSGIAAKTSLLALALTIGLSSVRMMPMVVSLMPYLRAGKPNLLALILCAHAVSISTWVEGLRLLPPLAPKERVPFFLGFGLGTIALSMIAACIGYNIAGVIPPRFAAMLLFLTPLFFLITLFRGATMRIDYLAIAFGFVGLGLGAWLLPHIDLLFGGLGGGTLAFFLTRKRA